MADKIEIRLSKQKIEDEITVDEFIELQEGNLKTAKVVMAKFVIDPKTGEYAEVEIAKKQIGKLTIGQLKELMQSFSGDMETTIVPLANSEASG